jgi:pyridoxine 5-phosphate synthase
MLKLGVNIDHVATLREARYKGRPDGEPCPVEAALACEKAGAHGITAHLREDRRHIQDRDVWELRKTISTRLNLEMANTAEMVEIALRLRPHIVCLVPERRQELTTEGGLDVAAQVDPIAQTAERLRAGGIETSLFIAPDLAQVAAAGRTGAGFIELHTGAYAEAYGSMEARNRELGRLREASSMARGLGLRVNAGHGLNYENIPALRAVPHLEELNIGHSIISRAMRTGLEEAVRQILRTMQDYPAIGSAPE